MSSGIVFDIDRFAVHDGPGIRTVVYLKGCPLGCLWCHSPEAQGPDPELVFYETLCIRCGCCVAACRRGAQELTEGRRHFHRLCCDQCGDCAALCPAGALEFKGHTWTAEQVLRVVQRDVMFYRFSGGGVTFSGGEPTRQPGFLEELLRGCKAADIHTAVETCGASRRVVLERIAPLVDLFLYDLKHMDPVAHRRFTGASNRQILANLAYLARRGNDIQLRLPVIPGYNDTEDNLARLGAFARSLGLRKLALLPYNSSASAKYRWLGREYFLSDLKPLTPERLEQLADQLRQWEMTVQIGG